MQFNKLKTAAANPPPPSIPPPSALVENLLDALKGARRRISGCKIKSYLIPFTTTFMAVQAFVEIVLIKSVLRAKDHVI